MFEPTPTLSIISISFLLQLENVIHMCNDKWSLGQEIEAILVLALWLNYASSRMLLLYVNGLG